MLCFLSAAVNGIEARCLLSEFIADGRLSSFMGSATHENPTIWYSTTAVSYWTGFLSEEKQSENLMREVGEAMCEG